MADIFENEAGEKFIWDGATRSFKPATPEQVQVGRAGILGQVASAIQGATGIPGMISPATGEALETVNPGSATAGLVTSLAVGHSLRCTPFRALLLMASAPCALHG